MNDQEPVIHIEKLSFQYGTTSVLNAIDLDINQQDFLGLVGPNGGGKSTLLKLILGILRPTAGTIRVFGDCPRRARVHVGYVPQYMMFDFNFPITVGEVVLTGRLGHVGLGKRYRPEDRRIAEEAMAQLELAPLAGREISALSGGERQRVLVARALAGKPKLLLLDEPTSSVDNHVEESFYAFLERLHETIPIVLVSHDLAFISAYVTRVACLNRQLVANPVTDVHAKDLEKLYSAPVQMWSHDCRL